MKQQNCTRNTKKGTLLHTFGLIYNIHNVHKLNINKIKK